MGLVQLLTSMTTAVARATQNSNNGFLQNLIQQTLLTAHPIGSIKMSTVNTNPSTYIGGTWVAWGTGRVPVGVDTGQTEFNTVEKTGGHKSLQSHSHFFGYGGGTLDQSNSPYITGRTITHNPGIEYTSTSVEGTGDSGNLPPYITCYMWKRTA